MQKYLRFIQSQFSSLTVYRVEAYGRWIMALFSALSYYFIWKLTSTTSADNHKLLVYFILYWGFLSALTSGKTAYFIAKDIRSGEINNYLVKPINYFATLILRGLAPVVFRIIIPSILLIVVMFIYPNIFLPTSPINLLLFLFSLVYCFLIWNFIMIIIGSVAFLGTEIRSLLTVFDLVINLTRGAYIPAYLFPNWLSKILFFTFIPYISAFSIELYQVSKSTSYIISSFAAATSWLIILYFIAIKTFKKGLRYYESNGS